MAAKAATERKINSLKLTAPVPLTEHPAAVYLASLGPSSERTMRGSLNAIASLLTNSECDALTLDWSNLRYQHGAAIRTALKQRYAPSTTNKMLCALRRVLKECRRLGLMSSEDYALAADIDSVREYPTLRGRALSGEEIAALVNTCQPEDEGRQKTIDVRDAALLAILRTGVRRSELARLNLENYKSPITLEIKGKGGKGRTVYLPEGALLFVESWLAIRGTEPGPLLCPLWKSGSLRYSGNSLARLTPDGILKIVKKRGAAAEVEESFSPHDFRRTFCSDLLDAGVDIVTVQKLAGHSDPKTTAKYDRRGEEVKRQATRHLKF